MRVSLLRVYVGGLSERPTSSDETESGMTAGSRSFHSAFGLLHCCVTDEYSSLSVCDTASAVA